MSLLLSPIARSLAIAGVLSGAFLVWLARHDAKVEKAAQAEVVSVVKDKADADANRSKEVREDVAAGKRGIRDPNRLRPLPEHLPAAPAKDRAGI